MTDRISVADVTLLAVSSVDLDDTQLALKKSRQGIRFGAVKFLTSADPSQIDPDIEYVRIPPMDLCGYNKFVLRDLVRYVDTPFCLMVQADGFVLNPHSFSPEFLDYDYIGAPWPAKLRLLDNTMLSLDNHRVGNGGFSLRSAKLLAITAQIDLDSLAFPSTSEDLVICHFLYHEMTAQGIRFPAPEIAARFSIESPGSFYGQDLQSAFGFHGKHLRDVAILNSRSDKFLEPQTSAHPSRLAPCPCGSGLRYKHCHGAPR